MLVLARIFKTLEKFTFFSILFCFLATNKFFVGHANGIRKKKLYGIRIERKTSHKKSLKQQVKIKLTIKCVCGRMWILDRTNMMLEQWKWKNVTKFLSILDANKSLEKSKICNWTFNYGFVIFLPLRLFFHWWNFCFRKLLFLFNFVLFPHISDPSISISLSFFQMRLVECTIREKLFSLLFFFIVERFWSSIFFRFFCKYQ